MAVRARLTRDFQITGRNSDGVGGLPLREPGHFTQLKRNPQLRRNPGEGRAYCSSISVWAHRASGLGRAQANSLAGAAAPRSGD